jgi:DNA-binding XRE family transcriptional regulator
LYKPPPGTEDNLGAGNALVPIEIDAAGKAELTVEERQPTEENTDWLSPLADEAVKAYIADARADKTSASALTNAWSERNALKEVVDARNELTKTQAELEKSARETRLSLEAIEKNKQAGDLRAKLTARLGDVTSKLDQITKKLVEVNMRASELEVRFRDGIRELRITAPLPPKD